MGHAAPCHQAFHEPPGRFISHEGNARTVGAEASWCESDDEQAGIHITQGANRAIVPIGVLNSEFLQVPNEPATRSAVLQFHAKAPPQLEPAPAVQPRQWAPVEMGACRIWSKPSMSQIVL